MMALTFKNPQLATKPTIASPSTSAPAREHCYLCEMPRMPWTLLREFSESVCRGCVNYEGTDRIEIIIGQAKQLKTNHELPRTPTGRSPPQRSNSHNHKIHSSGYLNAFSLKNGPTTPQDKVPTPTLGPHNPFSDFAAAAAFRGKDSMPSPAAFYHPAARESLPSPTVSGVAPGMMDFTRGFGGMAPHSHALTPTSGQAPPSLMSPAANLAYRQGIIAARIAAASAWAQKVGTPTGAAPQLPGSTSSSSTSAVSEDSSSPGTPAEEYKPITSSLNLDYSSKPPHVVKALQTISRATPFEVRFKKCHTERGRVFAVDASLKTGTDYDLKLYIEYPLGSGQVYTSASGVAKQMCRNSLKEMSRPLSSGFKYLEYEVRPEVGDWRLIGDLLPESVRSFKETVKEDLLPVPRIDPNYPTLPKFSISLSSPDTLGPMKRAGDSNNNTVTSPPLSLKRRSTDGYHGDIPGFPASKRMSADSPIARRPTSLTLAMPSPTQQPQRSPFCSTNSLAPPTPTYTHPIPSPQRSPVYYNIQRQSSTSPPSAEIMKCFLCCSQLEDTHFVQCPALADHKFCFPCSKDSIKQQGVKSEVFCPSGKRCKSITGNKTVPWAFMPGEITQILSTQIAPKYRYDRIGHSQTLAEARRDSSSREKSISP